MINAADKEKIYQSQQKDTWEFKKDASGYYWLRTASNSEVVGTSHRAFTRIEDCEANALMVGYNNSFNVPRGTTWEFYQDKKDEHRWRLLDSKGVVINRAHEGYKAAVSSQKNAIRHGYGLVSSVDTGVETDEWSDCGNQDCAKPANWLMYTLGLLLLVLAAMAFTSPRSAELSQLPNVDSEPASVVFEQSFTDVDPNGADASCIYTLAEESILSGYKYEDGTLTGTYGYNDPLSLNQLAKITLAATDTGLFSCAPTSQEPVGASWAMPYIRCATAKEWRTYSNNEREYTVNATMADSAATLLDAFELTEQQAADAGLLASLGGFAPEQEITRSQMARLLCDFRAASK